MPQCPWSVQSIVLITVLIGQFSSEWPSLGSHSSSYFKATVISHHKLQTNSALILTKFTDHVYKKHLWSSVDQYLKGP